MNKAIIKHTSEGNILVLDEKMPGDYSESCRIKKEYQLIHDNLDIDWEQRRYELAKYFESASLANPDYMELCTSLRNRGELPEERLAKVSIKYADALIEQLKSK
mgnify:CR=1 FL=1